MYNMSLADQLKSGIETLFYRYGASEQVTRIRITKTYNTDDDIVETSSSATLYAIVQVIDLEDANELGGLVKVGDAWAFFEHDSDVEVGDRIVHNGITYEIDRFFNEEVSGSSVFKQAYMKRVKY